MVLTMRSETAVLWAGPGVESTVLQGFHRLVRFLGGDFSVFKSFVFSFFIFLIFSIF